MCIPQATYLQHLQNEFSLMLLYKITTLLTTEGHHTDIKKEHIGEKNTYFH